MFGIQHFFSGFNRTLGNNIKKTISAPKNSVSINNNPLWWILIFFCYNVIYEEKFQCLEILFIQKTRTISQCLDPVLQKTTRQTVLTFTGWDLGEKDWHHYRDRPTCITTGSLAMFYTVWLLEKAFFYPNIPETDSGLV